MQSIARWVTKRNLVIVAAVIVVATAGVSVALFFKHRADQSHKVSQGIDNAMAAFNNGDYSQSLESLQQTAAQATNKQDKIKLYDQMASAASSGGQVGEALRYYDLKHQLDPSTAPADAYNMATLYERSDQNDKALAQFKIALKYLQSRPQDMQTKMDIEAVKSEINTLGGQ